jgi:hypothetical protein
MFNLPGFLVAQGVAFAGLGVYKWLTRERPKPEPLSPEEASRYKFVMPVISNAYERAVRVKHERIPLTKKQRFEILMRDKFTCQYCGRKPPEVTLEVDHKISVYNGGTNDPRNLITSCWQCNQGKGPKSIYPEQKVG